AATTIELAIYQALSYDYDLAHAALLAMIQLFCCVGLVLISQKLKGALSVGYGHQQQWRNPQDSWLRKLFDGLLISLALLLLL
ncbi:thiamine/thiamine pyrophosphate ABC transporter permease ThiP, partial [Xenorhabdus bovienii]|nr:thiamine/thiamine pyrophosphate ABC transporter permease ThiP [Xenorhabdus bovienii]